MLAGDPDEVRELAEGMLKDRSLSSYYDEVALKGLQLAANDFARGVVTPAQLENIRSSSRSLVEDFEDHEDAEPSSDSKAVNPSDTPTLAERTHPKTEAVPGQAAAAQRAAGRVARDNARPVPRPAAAPSTRHPRRCWRNCCASTVSGPGSPRTGRPRAKASAIST